MTTGNPLAHAIMRGSVNKHGNTFRITTMKFNACKRNVQEGWIC